jgi:hypothetical protein
MQDRPTAAELLQTLREYLQGEVLPNVEGTLRYHTLVAANIVTMLEREAQLYPAAAAKEVAALQSLLGSDDSDLLALNGALQARLQGAEELDPAFEARCWEVLFSAVLDKLAISKPGYEAYDMATEVG